MTVATAVYRGPMIALTLVWVGACLGNTELVSPPHTPISSITLEFRPDSEDAATAAALGWTNGIPGVQVTVTPADTTGGSPRVLQATDSGTLFLDQVAGRYAISVDRWLTDSERAHLPPGDDAVGFIARTSMNTTTSSARIRVDLVASRRKGLVISEFKGDPIEVPYGGEYFFSGYLRLYNNADTTIYLDGMIIGSGLAAQFDYSTYSCSFYQRYALDTLGVWAHELYKLPGRGTDYPLMPGASVVLATDAIDHRPLFSIGLDLRGANFEFYGGASDVDNPGVPNAVDVGPWSDPLGHGLIWSILGKVAIVARPFDLATMHTEFIISGTWDRMPASALLDVMAMKTTYQSGYQDCPSLVSPDFDRGAVQLLGTPFADDTLAYKRVQLPFRIDGHVILQYTRTSAWDFRVGRRDPFATP